MKNPNRMAAGSAILALSAALVPHTAAAQGARYDGDLAGLIPSLYGGDGITLYADPAFSHSAHFSGQTLERFNVLSASLAGRASPSFNLSPTSLFEYDEIAEEYVRIDSLGAPSFAVETAASIGKGRLGFGLAVSTRKYSSINGVDLDGLVIDLEHPDALNPGADICVGGVPPNCHLLELDIVRLNVDLDFRETTALFGVAYGLTDRFEVSLLAPLTQTGLDVRSVASIIEHESAALVSGSVHSFDASPGADQPVDSAAGDHFGIGDVILRAKYEILADAFGDNVDIAFGADLRVPSGSEANLQGVPHVGVTPKLIASANWTAGDVRITANAMAGYVVNATSNSGDAVRFAAGATLEPGIKLLNGDLAFTGAVIGWKPLRAVDFSTFSTVNTIAHNHADHAHADSEAFLESDIDAQIDASFGVHIPAFKRGYLFYEAQVPLNDPGLRADITHSAGVLISF